MDEKARRLIGEQDQHGYGLPRRLRLLFGEVALTITIALFSLLVTVPATAQAIEGATSIRWEGETANGGERWSRSEGNGRRVYAGFDRDGRLKHVSQWDGNISEIGYDSEGRVISIQDRSGKIPIEYGPEGIIGAVRYADGAEVGYEWNLRKQLSALIYPDGPKVAYSYTSDGNLKSIRLPEGGIVH